MCNCEKQAQKPKNRFSRKEIVAEIDMQIGHCDTLSSEFYEGWRVGASYVKRLIEEKKPLDNPPSKA